MSEMKTMINVTATLRFKGKVHQIVASRMTPKEKLYLQIGKALRDNNLEFDPVVAAEVEFNPNEMEIRVANIKVDPFRSFMFNTWNLNLPVVCYLQ